MPILLKNEKLDFMMTNMGKMTKCGVGALKEDFIKRAVVIAVFRLWQ